MKKNLKNLFSLCLVLFCCFMIVSCKKKTRVITIIQYASANALEDAKNGVIEALNNAGFIDGDNVEIVVQNPQGDANTLALIAQNAVRKSDLIVAIATPAALAVKNECEKQGSDVPVLFTAVTDPVASGLVASNEKPESNITGTNDMNPVSEQIALLKELNPNATKLGIIYTSSEPNSVIQVNLAIEKAKSIGIETVVQTVTSLNDIKTMMTALANSGVDAIYLPTDNNISSAITTATEVANENKIPTICGEEGMITGGGTITLGINYKNLGIITGQMGVEILNGKAVSDIPVQGLTNFTLVINKKVAEESNIIIPEALLAKADRVIE